MEFLKNLSQQLHLERLSEIMFWGNSLQQYLIALAILLGFLIFFKYFKNRLFKALKRWSDKTQTDLDNEFIQFGEEIPDSLYFFGALFFALQVITVHELVTTIVQTILVIIVFYWATKVSSQIIQYSLYKLAKKKGANKKEKSTTYFALNLIAKIALWSTGLLLILSNLGINITAFAASLGIGGIAVALAVQNILGDIFSSFTLYFDKPFEIGDYIIVGNHEGTVKRVGLKSTRISALQGEEIVISNKELTSTRVHNFKKMKRRRIAFQIGVTYDTKPEKLEKIPQLVQKIMESIDLVDFDRTHFKEFAPSSLTFEIVYFISSNVYKEYMDKQHEINIAILKAFAKEKIEMAFPTRTVHLKND